MLAPHAQALARAVAAGNQAGLANLVDQVSPTVLRISTVEADTGMPKSLRDTPLERLAPGRDGDSSGSQPRRMGEGSGFVIDPAGYVVINFHVAGRALQLKVTLPDGTELPARLVGADQRTDLALFKVEASHPLPIVAFKSSGTPPHMGDVVLAVGNPFGLGANVTAGIVSARGRDLGAGPYDDFLQADAAIHPGNSGGPLFGTDGRVIGVNTAIVSPSGGSVGIGFAIPSDLASKVVAELKEHGSVQRGWMGVELGPTTSPAKPAPG
ncbi:trypsin-like peptidase domain-containing protein [Roseomonas haemaphysalidis]|uniref:Trypsin-like peptidase domain-containing protein n=1 Tax=Roseomonas haemaphysalidis TaxID=2768162 RepID=A0ABS3KSF5_9PROT|nr:trypsin-like peptidase domain-containing protein [Roseomonas haemaphysalidis]MBO1079548.1 trypsin-like peptidase domain-containing protein [Roseomonas haemaphysalidis]